MHQPDREDGIVASKVFNCDLFDPEQKTRWVKQESVAWNRCWGIHPPENTFREESSRSTELMPSGHFLPLKKNKLDLFQRSQQFHTSTAISSSSPVSECISLIGKMALSRRKFSTATCSILNKKPDGSSKKALLGTGVGEFTPQRTRSGKNQAARRN